MRILVASFQVWYGTVLSPATRWTRVVTCSRRLPKPLPIYGDLSLSHFTGSSTEENKISFSPWLFFSVSQNLLQLWHCLWASDSIWTWRYFCPFNCHLWRARKHCQRMTSTKRSSGSRRRCRIALIELQKDTVLYLTVWKSKGQFAAIKQAKRVANKTVQAGSSILIGSSLLRVCFRILANFETLSLARWLVCDLCSAVSSQRVSSSVGNDRHRPRLAIVSGVWVWLLIETFIGWLLSRPEFRVSKIPLQIGPRSSRDASSSFDRISGNARRSWWSDIELKTSKSSSSGFFVKRCQHSHLRYEVSRE